ncbi:MAG: TIGR03986 family CRISPR-associated RAMP protein, partial [Blastocatellia bacterium]|nr:TIGR03986 family CRISPR-associated RAMP protein [Blastocatellia bacterium]
DDTDTFIPIDGYEKLWRDLILNYQNEHKRDLETRRKASPPQSPGDYLGDTPGKTAWSRHIDPGLEDGVLREGTLCYVELDRNNSHRITALFPVSISRRLYAASPEKLLEKSVKPAGHEDNLSPADRVFGWASQEGKGAYRGNLRIGPAMLPPPGSLTNFEGRGLPLAILSQPKPQQSRFYVARTKEKGEKQEDGLRKSEVAYVPSKGLRGRKVYPHHAGATAAEGYWAKPMEDRTQQGISTENGTFFQEYRQPHEGYPDNDKIQFDKNSDATQFKIQNDSDHEQRNDQNRSILSWVEPGTRFNFEIDVTNLSDVELGALLWLLDLNAGQDGPPRLFHRLGGGKPLGFGSVSLNVNWDRTHLSRGSAWEEFYSSFDSEAPRRDMNDAGKHCIELFQDAVAKTYREADFNQVPFIRAFLVCAEGFSAPIHYPRARPKPDQWAEGAALPPHPAGEAYEWFKTNEQLLDKKPRYAFCLPDLVTRQGLPILDIEDKEQRGRKQ